MVFMKSSNFSDITVCSVLKDNRDVRETCPHLQGPRINQGRNYHETGSSYLLGILLDPDDGGSVFFQNVC
jgi:hypothetical protein